MGWQARFHIPDTNEQHRLAKKETNVSDGGLERWSFGVLERWIGRILNPPPYAPRPIFVRLKLSSSGHVSILRRMTGDSSVTAGADLELAQRIYGPSYVSLETALSHHGWIPEAVQAITSVALGRSRTFNTPVGLFSFTRVPQGRFLSGVRRASVGGGGAFFLATPLKALADHVYAQRCDWHCAAPVVESLRVEDQALAELTGELFEEVMSAYKPGRVCRFLTGLREDLKL